MPGGVNSPVRAFAAVGGEPIFIERGEGPFLFDVDGKRYLDLVGAFGPLILGHAHPAVVEALQQQATRGTAYGAPTDGESELAEMLVQHIPSLEMVRLVNSGTEATMSALRLARAVTGRDLLVKFAGGYHGHMDYLLAEAGSGLATLGIPSSPGVPVTAAALTVVLPYNDTDAVEKAFAQRGTEIAAVIVEPIAGNMGVVPGTPEFLATLRRLCSERAALLIFDEVITGFRYSPGGAQQVYGVTPDLTTLAKIIAGGLPGGAVVGKHDILEVQTFKGELHKDRFERVLQQGTFNANPMSAAAGLTALQIVGEGWATEQANQAGEQLRAGLRDCLEKRGVAGAILGEFSVFQILLGEGMEEAVETTDVQRLMAGRGAVNTLRKVMLLNGVDLMRSGGFTSIVHGDEELSHTIDAFDKSLEALQQEGLA
jgi:glutamate-1-semialdehyde 2,1-aminomutase